MEKYDPGMAQRVWDRVWAQPEQSKDGVGAFILRESRAVADYGRLSRRYPEMKVLTEETRRILFCLRGIAALTAGKTPAIPTSRRKDEPAAATLQRCIYPCLKAAADYAALSQETEFGCIYGQLAEMKRRHCRTLLELLGRPEEK